MAYKLYTDGSYNAFTNLAGFGGYLLNEDGDTVFEFSEVINDPKLQKHHEALSLEKGLTLCLEKGIKQIISYTDAKQMALVCNTKDLSVQKIYTDRNPILKRIAKLIPSFESIDFHYLPRRWNAKADLLSRRAVEEVKKNRSEVNDVKFTSDHIDFSKKYNNKKDFIKVHSKIENFIIISSSSNDREIKVYYVNINKTKETSEVKLLEKIEIDNNSIGIIAQCFNKALLKVNNIKEIIIYAQGEFAQDFEAVIKGVVPLNQLSDKIADSFNNLKKTIELFDKVIYHFDNVAMDKVFNPNNKKPKTAEEIIEALKILGNDDYTLGKDKELEEYFVLKRNQKNNIIYIQQRFFTQFLKISIKEKTMSEKIHPDIRSKEKAEKIQQIKEDLIKQGIKFRG